MDRLTDGQTDICNSRVAFATENHERIFHMFQGSFHLKKSDETYGIFHMLVDPPTPSQHMENLPLFFIV